MLTAYLEKKLKSTKFKRLGDGSYFGEIPGLRGVWANASSLRICRKELQEVLEDWLVLKVRDRETIPGFSINIDRRFLLRHGA